MKKTKIDWADSSWNPVSGCLHGCEYCYARKIARRFCTNYHGHDCGVAAPCTGDCKFCSELDGLEFVGVKHRWNHFKDAYPYGFMPTFHPHRLEEPSRWKKPRTIFVCSMADLFGDWVPYEWIQKVFEACQAAPHHRYLFLTKNPDRYINLAKQRLLPMEENFWYGSSTPTMDHKFFWHTGVNTFVSIEPILEPFTDLLDDSIAAVKRCGWIIVGAETGNRKEKVIPKKSWIMELKKTAAECDVPIFMKESLREIMGDDFIQQYPWEDRT